MARLGYGGMSMVYKGFDVRMKRLVAIKVMNAYFYKFSERESEALGKLMHPNIVQVFHTGEHNNFVYIVMEYVEGKTLSAMEDAPLDAKMSYLKQSLVALDYAHQQRVIHRDIKPSNLMVREDGVVKVMDFGLARIDGDTNQTRTADLAGTPRYMSPEQILDRPTLDHRTDLYSLGKTFYNLVAGRLPFEPEEASRFEIQRQIVEGKFKPPSYYNPMLPVAVDRILMKAIAKEPEDRYDSAIEMLEDVNREILFGSIKSVDVEELPTPPKKQESSFRTAGLVSGMLGVVLLTIAFVWGGNEWMDPLTEVFARSDSLGTATDTTTVSPFDRNEALEQLRRDSLLLGMIQFYPGDADTSIMPVLGDTTGRVIQVRPPWQNQVPTLLDTTLVAQGPGAVDSVATEPAPPTAAPETPEEIATTAYLTLDVEPADAEVFINGYSQGTGSLVMLELEPGVHDIYVSKPYHREWFTRFTAEAGNTHRIDAGLQILRGNARIRVAPLGRLYMNGTVMARYETDDYQSISLAHGEYIIRADNPATGAFITRRWTFVGQTIPLEFDLSAETQVVVDAGVADQAIVLISGNKEGTTMETLSLLPGVHRIEVNKEGCFTSPPFQDLTLDGDNTDRRVVSFSLSCEE